jgi:transposase
VKFSTAFCSSYATGAPWADLPERHPPYQACHRRFQQWVRTGVMGGVLEALAEDLRSRGGFDLEEPSSTAVSLLQERGRWRGQNQATKKNQNHGQCRPPMVFRSRFAQKSATPHDVKLVMQTLAQVFVEEPSSA